MKITDATITQSAQHALTKSYERRENLEIWDDTPRSTDLDTEEKSPPRLPEKDVIVSLSEKAPSLAPAQEESNSASEEDMSAEDPRMRKMRLALEMLTGKKIRISTFSPHVGPEIIGKEIDSSSQTTPPRQGWGIIYDLQEIQSEQEILQYEARGGVYTADGRTYNFTLQFALDRKTTSETAVHIRAGDALLVDPLVINFSGTSARLGDINISFDLDLDGKKEEIPFLQEGSGFLVLDRNGDNIVNNGSELLGPATGSGFKELQQLDLDQNGWLDENDPLFEKLKIWMKDTAGNDYFATLAQKGVGAIYLNPVESPFTLTGQDNLLLGQLQETSFYLTQKGLGGTLQEIDIAV